ncbi:disease resistance protein Pik-2-like [Phragmites australis]|uniref:disease resistance protein Pik-2-like n=1 Tax=Phragmites australis TaxID=29695 RepID=UPI002D76B6FC|nr:disease resistance protein Pik-2-like [Phragmites australis]
MELAVGASEATLKSLLSKLGSLLAEDYSLIRGVRGDIQFINDELASMQAFLSNLSRSDEGHDDQTEDWMKQVRDVAYDIEDCIDDFAHNLDPDPRGNDWLTVIRRTLYEIRTWSTRRSIAAKIGELKERAQHVGDRRGRYGVPDPKPSKKKSNLGGATGYLAAEHQEIARQLVGVQQPVGVKNMPDLEKWITFDEKRKKPGVLTIVGFGGVGKTTVAMALYRKFGPQFQRRAMVTVSQNSDPDVVLWNILSQVKSMANNGERRGEDITGAISEKKIPVIGSILSRIRLPSRNQKEDGSAGQDKHSQIRTELKSNLETTRYLLLIDDVWSSSTWQTVKNCFPENDKGSRIIVTTRFQAVATTCSARKDHDRVHPVEVLSGDEPRNLFFKTMSECRGTGDRQPIQSKVPGRVWEMCGGLPLAIVTMSGLVASKPLMIREEWITFCNSLFPEPERCRKPEDFMRIINYCYNDLPSDLKTCSLYLSIFPKGRKVSRKRLIRRWIAEGFVSEKQGLSIEDVAETCFNQLIERKIIRPVEHNMNGRVKSCQVHDMVLEYIISKAAEEDFVTVVGSHWSMPTRSNKVRRLSLHSSDSKGANNVDRMNLSHVRSLTVFGSLDKLHFKSFKTGIVQVLDLEGCSGFKENRVKVSDLCEMILLKYLSLRRTDIKNLPQNISKLKYLETLDIRETEVQQLPATVGLLERINNILGGDKRRRKTLKLPKELKGTMKTLRILSGIEIVEGSTAASDLRFFTALRKLAIYRIHKNDEIFKDLLSSIQYLSGYSLQTLVIDDESSEFLKTLDSMSSYPTDLRALELSGKLLILPKWLKSLDGIVKLTLSATVLRADNLMVLSKLSSLFSLTFSISEKQDPAMAAILEKNKSYSGGEIFVPAGGFSKLKLLRIFVPLLPSLNFAKKATPVLERIELRFKRLEGLHGMDELGMLHDVLLTVDGQASEQTQFILETLKKGKKQSSKYALIVNEYHD